MHYTAGHVMPKVNTRLERCHLATECEQYGDNQKRICFPQVEVTSDKGTCAINRRISDPKELYCKSANSFNLTNLQLEDIWPK